MWLLEAPTVYRHIEDKASSKENKKQIVVKTESDSVQQECHKSKKRETGMARYVPSFRTQEGKEGRRIAVRPTWL